MRNLAFLLVVSLALPLLSAAQLAMKPATNTHKAIAISGRVSDDGKMFVRDEDAVVLTLTNPEMLKGREGQRVQIGAYEVPDKNELRVLFLKPESAEVRYAARLQDSAFRR